MKTVKVKVKPNAKENRLEETEDGTWVARVKAPPVKGKANKELISLIAHHFNLRRSQVTITKGITARTKLIQLDV